MKKLFIYCKLRYSALAVKQADKKYIKLLN